MTSLELVSPAALVVHQRRSRHVGSASLGSAVVIASLAVCVGVGYVGMLVAIVAATTLVALCVAATHSRWGQHGLDRYRVHRARARRETARQRALGRAARPRQEQYLELYGLVDGIEGGDPVEARRLELQELLDHFVQLAVGHQRCLESLRSVGGLQLPATTPTAPSCTGQAVPPNGDAERARASTCAGLSVGERPSAKHRADIAARRRRHRDETTARLERIADELDSADELIRLVAQRVACASLDPLTDGEGELDRRLAELDDIEAAMGQVTA